MVWITVICELIKLLIVFIVFICIGFFVIVGLIVWYLFKYLYSAIKSLKKGGVK